MAQSKIAKGAIISYVSIFLNIVISLVYTPWMIRQIGVSDYGLYSLVGAFLGYFTLDFGLSGTITRFIAKYRAEGGEHVGTDSESLFRAGCHHLLSDFCALFFPNRHLRRWSYPRRD